MPVSKNKRKKKDSGTRVIRTPKLLEKLTCTESAVQRIAQGNNAAVMRMYFGTADKNDANYLYTHLAVCWLLAERMLEKQDIQSELFKGVALLIRFYKNGKLEHEEIDALQNILRFSMELWRKSTVEEIIRLTRAIQAGEIKVNFSISDSTPDNNPEVHSNC